MEQDVSLRERVFSELISEKQVIICLILKNHEIMQASIKISDTQYVQLHQKYKLMKNTLNAPE